MQEQKQYSVGVWAISAARGPQRSVQNPRESGGFHRVEDAHISEGGDGIRGREATRASSLTHISRQWRRGE